MISQSLLEALRATPRSAGAEAIFSLLAIFAEEATVPVAAIDAVLPLIQLPPARARPREAGEKQRERRPREGEKEGERRTREAGEKEGGVSQQRRHARQCLQQLLKLHVLRGSIEGGVCAHDLVRDCMLVTRTLTLTLTLTLALALALALTLTRWSLRPRPRA